MSCEKDEQSINSVHNFDETENILRMASKQEFDNLMDQLKYNNESSLIPDDFISLYQKINTTTKSTEEVEEDTLIYGEYFKKLLNPNYELIVANVLYKVTPFGTFFCMSEKMESLRYFSDQKDISVLLEPVNPPNFIPQRQNENGFFKVKNQDIYLFDTYNKFNTNESSKQIEKINLNQDNIKFKSSSFDNRFSKTISENKTVFGKAFAYLFGWSKSENVKYDHNSKRRLHVRFYTQDFVIYTEAGIGVKTQAKRWIGWSKTKARELRAGVNNLVFKEKYPSLSKDYIQQMWNQIEPYRDPYTYEYHRWLGIVNATYEKKTYLTIDFMDDRFDYDLLTNKDVLNLIKGGHGYLKSKFGGSGLPNESEIDGVRIINPHKPHEAKVFFKEKVQKAHDDEDMTLLLDKDFGFVVGFSLRFGNGPVAKDDYTPILKGVAADYDIVKGELWGAGDVGGEWQGILLKYKM